MHYKGMYVTQLVNPFWKIIIFDYKPKDNLRWFRWCFCFFCLGQWSTCVWVHCPSLLGLRVPGCFGAGDGGRYRHCPGAVLHLWAHDHCKELPGCLPLWQVERQGRVWTNSTSVLFSGVALFCGAPVDSHFLLLDPAKLALLFVRWFRCMSKAPSSSPLQSRWWMDRRVLRSCSLKPISYHWWKSTASVQYRQIHTQTFNVFTAADTHFTLSVNLIRNYPAWVNCSCSSLSRPPQTTACQILTRIKIKGIQREFKLLQIETLM